MKSKIIPNISTYNFEYRVVRHIRKDSDGNACVIDGKLETYFDIYEIHFGCDGEIVTYCTKNETPIGDSLENLRYEVEEYLEAIHKPVINFDFLQDQTSRSMRRIKNDIKKGNEPTSEIGQCAKDLDQIEKGEVQTIPWEEVVEKLGYIRPTYEYIPYKEAVKRFNMNAYQGEKDSE